MEREDARKLSSAEQLERRRQVIRAHKRGRSRTQIAEDVGLSYTAVVNTIQRYESLGMLGLTSGKRGRPVQSSRKLSDEQEQRIRRLIQEKRPEQLKMDFALWTRAAVMLLIERECGVKMIVRTVGKLLKRWRFTPQKPIRRAYEQNPVAMQQWLNESYPTIAKRASIEGAEIHWGDETALVNTDVRGRGFAPRGQTPVTRVVGGTRQKLSMISTVTNQGKTC
jgi:transposase